MISTQEEQLTQTLYDATKHEIAGYAAKRELMVADVPANGDNGGTLSVLDIERRSHELLVQSFHLSDDNLMVIKTQAIIEVMKGRTAIADRSPGSASGASSLDQGTVPHSGHRSGEPRRSYPHRTHRPPTARRVDRRCRTPSVTADVAGNVPSIQGGTATIRSTPIVHGHDPYASPPQAVV